MNVYIDFDDCLCETALMFVKMAKKLFGKDISYADMEYFDLQRTFSLSDEQFGEMMRDGHTTEALLSIEEAKGASSVVNGWISEGHTVSVITGRPPSVYEASRKWLDEHNLYGAKLYCFDKYGRDSFIKGSEFAALEPEEYFRMKFDFAVEDSPKAFKFLTHLPNLKVAVFDRPWNREHEFPNQNFIRCTDWEAVELEFEKHRQALLQVHAGRDRRY